MTVTTAPPAAAPPQGLSSVPQLNVFTAPQERCRFPTAQMVGSAAALFHTSPPWTGAEGRSFRVQLSAGTVGVTMSDPARRERNALNALGHETRGGREVYAPLRHRLKDADGIPAGVVLDTSGDFPELVFDDGEPWGFAEERPTRQVGGWSRKSRSRMVRRLAQLDWTPMAVDVYGYPAHLGYGSPKAPVMLTLTYPGPWQEVAPTGKAVKRHLERFYLAYRRRWGLPFVGAWKLEFQRRGAPHIHFLTVAPRDPDFKGWLSATWARIVNHPDPEERRKHQLAGTGIDHLRGGRAFDPKRAAVYFSKHGGAAGGKEYQHNVPEEWQQPGAGPGRFWGYKGLTPVVADVGLSVQEYVQLRRTLRRYSQAQGMSRTSRVPRGVDTRTGEILYRTVTRPYALLSQGGLQGGTLVVNDGPAFAAALSRHPAIQRARAEGDRACPVVETVLT